MAKNKKSGRTPNHDKRPPQPDRSGGHSGGHGGGHDKIWLYGNHAVEAALANPLRKKHKLVVAKEFGGDMIEGMEAEVMDRREMDRLLPPGAVHQGMALLASPLPEPDLAAICESAGESSILVVLDQANDPRNVGAVLRSAAAFGADAVIVPDRHTPEATAVLAKAASGALDRVPFVRVTNLARTMDQLKDAGYWFAGLTGDGDQTLAEAKLSSKTALVLGAEGAGLRRLTREKCDFLVRIPINPGQESLNLSAAAAISLYELRRGA